MPQHALVSLVITVVAIVIVEILRKRTLQRPVTPRLASVRECVTLTTSYLDSVEMVVNKHYDTDDPSMRWYRTYDRQTDAFQHAGDVYDNALVLSYLVSNGRHDQAWRLAHTYLYLMNYERYDVAGVTVEDRVLRFRGLKPRYDVLPDTQRVRPGAEAWVALDVGNNSYAAIALYKFGLAYDAILRSVYGGVNPFLRAAIDVARLVHRSARCVQEGEIVGYVARPFSTNEYQTYMSNEHMIDMYALAELVLQHPEDASEEARADLGVVRDVSHGFVSKLYGEKTGNYDVGAGVCFPPRRDVSDEPDGSPPAPGPFSPVSVRHRDGNTPEEWATYNYIAIPVDTQTWNLLADADDNRDRKIASLDWAVRTCLVRDTMHGSRGCYESDEAVRAAPHKADISNVSCDDVDEADVLYGFRFTEWGHGIQWENAGSGVMALMRAELKYGLEGRYSKEIELIVRSIRRVMTARARKGEVGMVANLRVREQYAGADAESFMNTGLTWGYYRAPHLGGTVYCTLALQYYEAYKRGDLAAADVFNPYSTVVPRVSADASQVHKFGNAIADATDLAHEFLDANALKCPFASADEVLPGCTDTNAGFDSYKPSHYWACDPNRNSWYRSDPGDDDFWKLFGSTYEEARDARCSAQALSLCPDPVRAAMINAFENRYATGACPPHQS
jgi:hypothetical protein